MSRVTVIKVKPNIRSKEIIKFNFWFVLKKTYFANVTGNCRNQAFLEMLRQLGKTQALLEMPRQ